MKKDEFLKIIEANQDLLDPQILELVKKNQDTLSEEVISFIASQISLTSRSIQVIDQVTPEVISIYEDASREAKGLKNKLVASHQRQMGEWSQAQSAVDSKEADQILSHL